MSLRALVLFGSSADEPVVLPILDGMRAAGIEPALAYVSAHRNPDQLEALLKSERFDFIVAGAGLAAHLPGVAASKTLKPVIGVPVSAAFGGADALFSIVQMPPGIPVWSAAPLAAGAFAKLWKKTFAAVAEGLEPANRPTRVCFLGDSRVINGDLTRKARAIFAAAGVQCVDRVAKGAVSIVAAPGGVAPKLPHGLSVLVPTFTDAGLKSSASAMKLYRNLIASGPVGLWTGANNFTNAACLALQLMNGGGRFDALLSQAKRGAFRG